MKIQILRRALTSFSKRENSISMIKAGSKSRLEVTDTFLNYTVAPDFSAWLCNYI